MLARLERRYNHSTVVISDNGVVVPVGWRMFMLIARGLLLWGPRFGCCLA